MGATMTPPDMRTDGDSFAPDQGQVDQLVREKFLETEFDSTEEMVPRDGKGRPLILMPDGSRVAYTRPSTFVETLEDSYKLMLWKTRLTAIGMAMRPDLVLATARALHIDDEAARKAEIDRLVLEAMIIAGYESGSNAGTALHGFADEIDAGKDVFAVPVAYQPGLNAYSRVTKWFRMVSRETWSGTQTFGVCDEITAAGSWDRIVEFILPGDPDAPDGPWPFEFPPEDVAGWQFIWDLKTAQRPEYSWLKWAGQTAIYAHCQRYDPSTGDRQPLSPNGGQIHQSKGIIASQRSGSNTAELYWIDLETGWEAVKLTLKVREMRGRRSKMKEKFFEVGPLSVSEQIEYATSRSQLRTIWVTNDLTEGSTLGKQARRRAHDLPKDS